MANSPAALAAQAHQRELGRPFQDVPQWRVEGKPLRVYWTPMTVKEADELAEYRGRPEGDIYVLIKKAQDEQGKPLFTLEDKHLLMLDANWHTIAGLALLMCAMPSVDAAEKKSAATPT